jgi:hypothetical protein
LNDLTAAKSSIFDKLVASRDTSPSTKNLQALTTLSDCPVALSNEDTFALTNLDSRLSRNLLAWERIDQSVGSLGKLRADELVPDKIPIAASDLKQALTAEARRNHNFQDCQVALLGTIAETGKKQTQIMPDITKLLEMLLKEALENTRFQRVVLYFGALSAFLTLVALFE